MNKKFRFICLLLATCSCIMLTACDGGKEGKTPTQKEPIKLEEISKEVYDSLPDETQYDKNGLIIATGKDLIEYDRIVP